MMCGRWKLFSLLDKNSMPHLHRFLINSAYILFSLSIYIYCPPQNIGRYAIVLFRRIGRKQRNLAMPCLGRSCWSLFLVAVLVLMGASSRGECMRDLRDFKSTFESQLAKGPVPPSGPSQCHNNLSPYKDNKSSFQDEDYYVVCP